MAGLFDFTIVRKSEHDRLQRRVARSDDNETAAQDLAFLKAIRPEARSRCLDLLDQSQSQLRQDLFVLAELDFLEGGYFVEFGAASGKDLSNTYLLEKAFGWSGILAEPARVWHAELEAHRDCIIETRCVWTTTGETLVFNETPRAELSTIDAFSFQDRQGHKRKDGKTYEVETISLNDLLTSHAAPTRIDYMSVDTEGSEYDILSAFDFDAHNVRVISCEHNKSENRQKIHDLLASHGYERRLEAVSRVDDWYVRVS